MMFASRFLPMFANNIRMPEPTSRLANLRRAISVLSMKRINNSGTRSDAADAEVARADNPVELRNVKANGKLNLKSLRDRSKKGDEEERLSVKRVKGKVRAVVDLEMMKEELKQLNDPPSSPLAKELSAARLGFSFFDSPCEQLAQNLLGNLLMIVKSFLITNGFVLGCLKSNYGFN